MKIIKNLLLKIVIFTAVKNYCILHGHVFGMLGSSLTFVNMSHASCSVQISKFVDKVQQFAISNGFLSMLIHICQLYRMFSIAPIWCGQPKKQILSLE